MIALDSSAIIALVLPWHKHHVETLKHVSPISDLGVPFHAYVETFSVLTRLDKGNAISPEDASSALESMFPSGPFILNAKDHRSFLRYFKSRLVGGATYDALNLFTAKCHNATVMTLDRRSLRTASVVNAHVICILDI